MGSRHEDDRRDRHPETGRGGGSVVLARRGRTLRPQAADDLECADEQLDIVEADSHVWKAEGCGRSMVYARYGSAMKAPIERATFDLSCQRGDLSAAYLGDDTVGVSGCGGKATYVFVRRSGTWVMNSSDQ